MIAVVCLSEKGGMFFLGRRQSKDKKLIADLAELVGDRILYTDSYSAPLFSGSDVSVICASSPMEIANGDDFVFVENEKISPYKERLTGLVIYRWNRDYPADLFFDIAPLELGLRLVETKDFAGNSHEKITREIYKM